MLEVVVFLGLGLRLLLPLPPVLPSPGFAGVVLSTGGLLLSAGGVLLSAGGVWLFPEEFPSCFSSSSIFFLSSSFASSPC